MFIWGAITMSIGYVRLVLVLVLSLLLMIFSIVEGGEEVLKRRK